MPRARCRGLLLLAMVCFAPFLPQAAHGGEEAGRSSSLQVGKTMRDGRYFYFELRNAGKEPLADISMEFRFLGNGRVIAASEHIYGLSGLVLRAGATVPLRALLDRSLPPRGRFQYQYRWKARKVAAGPAPKVESIRLEAAPGYGGYIYAYITFSNPSSTPVDLGAFGIGLYDDAGELILAQQSSGGGVLAPGGKRKVETILNNDILDELHADLGVAKWQQRVDRLRAVAYASPAIAPQRAGAEKARKAVQWIIDRIAAGRLSAEEKENLFAHLIKHLQKLPAETAADLVLAGDPISPKMSVDQITEVRDFLRRNYLDPLRSRLEQEKKRGAPRSRTERLEAELAGFVRSDENLRRMLVSRRLVEGALSAFHDRRPFGKELAEVLKGADPELRRHVAARLRKWADGFGSEKSRAQAKRVLNHLRDGTLSSYVEQLAEADRRAFERELARRQQYLDAMLAARKEAAAKARAIQRTQILDFLNGEVPRFRRYVERSRPGDERYGREVAQLERIHEEMKAIQRREMAGRVTEADEERFERLWHDARWIINTNYASITDSFEERAKEMKFWQGVAEQTKEFAGNTLVALSAAATGGTSIAARAALIRAGTAGFTKFWDAYFVKKDPGALAAYNGISTAVLSAVPGGTEFKQKMAVNFLKASMAAYKDTMIDVVRDVSGRVPLKRDLRDHFIDKVMKTYGKATVGAFAGMGDFDSKAVQVAIRAAAGQFYDLMLKGGAGRGSFDVGD